jgi:hypothetical protein
MNKETVGNENLPNVYIDNIEIDSSTIGEVGTEYSIEVTVVMVDISETPTWFGRIDDLKVKCAFVTDERIEELNNGNLSLHSFASVGVLTRFTLVESCSDLELFNTEAGYSYYRKIFKIKVTNPINLNVYAACFMDDLGFGIDLFDKFYGPMSGEAIFIQGRINSDSGYFYYPDTNEEYGGPVHTHNQGYMVGSQHSEEPHSRVIYVQEENFKITSPQDFGEFDAILGGPSIPLANTSSETNEAEDLRSNMTMSSTSASPSSTGGY